MFTQIRKRDGRLVSFYEVKITDAIFEQLEKLNANYKIVKYF